MKNENKCVLYYSNRVDFKKLTQHDFNNWSQKQTFIQFISIWPFKTKIIRNVWLKILIGSSETFFIGYQ